MSDKQNLFDRLFTKSKSSDMVLLKSQVTELKSKLEEATFDDYVSMNQTPYRKGFDDMGFGGGGNSMNYHGAVDAEIDIGTLQKLFVSEGWFYITVFTIAKTIAALPLKLETKKITEEPVDPSKPEAGTVSKENWVDASGEPEQMIFKYPNDSQTAVEFYWLLLIDLLATGNAFIFIDSGFAAVEVKSRTKAIKSLNKFMKQEPAYGTPVMKTQGLYRMNPSLVQPMMKSNDTAQQVGGYQYNGPDGMYNFAREEIVHVRMPNPVDPYMGLAPIVPVYKNLLLDRYSTEHMIRFYKSGARLGGVIKSTKNLSKDQLTRLQRSFDQDYTGRQNHHRTLVLPNGMDYEMIEQNPAETSLLEFSKANREPILSAYNVPPIKVGLLDGATFANAMVQQKVFFVDTIIPILTLLEQSFNRSDRLLPAHKNMQVKFDLTGVESLQDNKAEQASAARAMLDAGFTVNEVRRDVWKKAPLEGGDKSPTIEKMSGGAAASPFAAFGMASAQQGETKDIDSDMGALAHLDGPQITSVMNICRRASNNQLKSEAALVMLSTMFGIPESKARAMLGMPALEVPSPTTSAQTKDDLPNAQPDSAGIASDITPTRVSFEQRVQQLVQVAVSAGYPLDTAIANAIAQAQLEGFAPSVNPDTNVSPQVQSDANNQTAVDQKVDEPVQAEEWKPVLVGEEKPLDDDEKSSSDSEAGMHEHKFSASASETSGDGEHIHVFVLPDGTEISTDPSEGGHVHVIPVGENDEPSGAHTHTINYNGGTITVSESGSHTHEFEADATFFGGEHIHTFTMEDGTVINSITTANIRDEITPKDAKSPEDELKQRAYEGCPITKADLINFRKDMSETGVKTLIEKNDAYFKAMFGRMGKMFEDAWGKKLKKYGIFYKVKGNDEDVVDNQKIKQFAESEAEKMAETLQDSSKYGYEKQLIQYKLKYPNEDLAELLRKIAAKKVVMITETTRNQINKMVSDGQSEGLTVGQVTDNMRSYFKMDEGMPARRLQTITRTETLSAMSIGQNEKNQQFKKEYPEVKLRKIWITAQDERVRGNPDGLYPDAEESHWDLEGEVVDDEDTFSNGLKFPRDPDGEAGQVINCRCSFMAFTSDEEDVIKDNLTAEESPLADVDEGSSDEEKSLDKVIVKGGEGSGGKREGAGRPKGETPDSDVNPDKVQSEIDNDAIINPPEEVLDVTNSKHGNSKSSKEMKMTLKKLENLYKEDIDSNDPAQREARKEERIKLCKDYLKQFKEENGWAPKATERMLTGVSLMGINGLSIETDSLDFYTKSVELSEVSEVSFNAICNARMSLKYGLSIGGKWNSESILSIAHIESVIDSLPIGHVTNNEYLNKIENHSDRKNSSYAHYSGKYKTISFSDSANDKAGRLVKNDEGRDALEFKSTVYHEIGHALSMKFREQYPEKFREFAKMSGFNDKILENRNFKNPPKGEGSFVSATVLSREEGSKPLVSKYAETNPEEHFAELYADYCMNKFNKADARRKESFEKILKTGEYESGGTRPMSRSGLHSEESIKNNIKYFQWMDKNLFNDKKMIKFLEPKGGEGSGGAREGAGRKPSVSPMYAPSGSLNRPVIVDVDPRSPSHSYFSARNSLIEEGLVNESNLPKFDSWWIHRGSDLEGQSSERIVSDFNAYTYDLDPNNTPSLPVSRPKPQPEATA